MSLDQFAEIFGRKVRIIDLSQPLEDSSGEPNPVNIKRISHEECAEMWEHLFDIPPSALPTGSGFAGEIIEASSHAGTHIDAPWHYSKNNLNNSPSRKIDELPLNMFIGKGVVIDVSDLPSTHFVVPEDIESRLNRIGHTLNRGEIVMFRTGADRYWGTEDYFSSGCGLGEDSVNYLVENGVRVIGTDAWSLDRPYPVITEEWQQKKESNVLWPAHFAGRKAEYSQIEKLTNLQKLPAVGSTIICLPVKIKEGSGAWSRVIGLVPVDKD